nr:undecaprenyl/decaprenyl-phosphate alpha-N-acetylglucosaminyl 1-phosphate transferase [Wenzhouxiangella sp. XN79A]
MLNKPAARLGLVDHPNHRKQHEAPTPLTGGLALALGAVAAFLVAFGGQWQPFWTLALGAAVLLVVGLLDDIRELSASLRFLVQIFVAAVMVYGGGLEVQSLGPVFGAGLGNIGLGPFSGLFTIACVVFMINAVNMMDGLDGLAGGAAFVAFLLLYAVALLDGAPAGLRALPLLMAGATLGFLVYNLRRPIRPRARAFLGDNGSMVLGYAMAWLAIAIATREGAGVYPVTIAWLLIIPAMDTLALFVRRIRLGRSPFSADRAHLHHLLQRAGYRVSTSVYMIHALVLLAGLFGVLGWQQGWPPALLFVLAAAVLIGYQLLLARAARLLRWRHRRRRRRNGEAADGGPNGRRRPVTIQHSSGHIGPRSSRRGGQP